MNDGARMSAFNEFKRLLKKLHAISFSDSRNEMIILNIIKNHNKNFIDHINNHYKLFIIPFIKIKLQRGEYEHVKGRFNRLKEFHYITLEQDKKYIISAFAFYFLIIPEAYGIFKINGLKSLMSRNENIANYLTEGNNYIRTTNAKININNTPPLQYELSGGGENIEDTYTINYTI